MRNWFKRSNVETVRQYVRAANERDYDTIRSLLAEDVRLIDTSGDEVCGRDNCLAIIRKAHFLAPDFLLRIDRLSRRGDEVYMTGEATGVDPRLTRATQFRARADHRVIHEWQSFGNHPTRVFNYLSGSPEPSGDAA